MSVVDDGIKVAKRLWPLAAPFPYALLSVLSPRDPDEPSPLAMAILFAILADAMPKKGRRK